MNQYLWGQEKDLSNWLYNNRLDGFSKMVRDIAPEDAKRRDILQRLSINAPKAFEKLSGYLAELEAAKQAS
jgi:hypothetical protein